MGDMEQLTKRQKSVFEFIRDKIRNRGYGPTVREIGEQFKIASPNGVMCHLKALEKKGLISREPNMSRAIQLAVEPAEDFHTHVKTIDGRLARRRLDHCFVGGMFAGRVRSVSADIGEIASDHFPLRVDIDLETPANATGARGG